MNQKKLEKLKLELRRLRSSPQNAFSIESLAKQLGRVKLTGSKTHGKEPIWVNIEFEFLRPLSIPHHGGKDLALGTKNSILNQLEDDIFAWDVRLENQNLNNEEQDDDRTESGDDNTNGR